MFQLPELPYSYNFLEPFIDEETMRVHHDGHHAAYIKNLNDALASHDSFLKMDIETLLKSLDSVPEEVRIKVKNNAGGHFHHSFFWEILAPNGGMGPKGNLKKMINEAFGDFNSFKEKFNQSAMSLFGSGWTWLLLDKEKLIIENTPNQDSPISVGKYPLFVIDLWEHAYYLKYKNKRVDYVNNFWNVVNWESVENKFDRQFSIKK